jgi:hypothetical protein
MKRVLLVLACLALASPAWAIKQRRIPRVPNTPLAPATVTITGSPLTVVIGGDTSMQVYNSNVPGLGQFYPPDCSAGETADSGVFLGFAPNIIGPDFGNHPCGSAANTYIPWTPVSLSPVTGTGTSSDPFTVVIVADAAVLQVRLTETVTYVNGSPGANISLSLATAPPPSVPEAPTGGGTWNAFLGGDLFLADNDQGFGAQQGNQIGGRGADNNCLQLQYTILFGGSTAPTNWTSTAYSTVWDEISAGSLPNNVDSTICQDNGAALEWANLTISGTPVVVGTGVSFAGQAVPVATTVPALSTAGIAAVVLLLAVVGYVLARKTSLGA